jgi:ABC-type lipoprotein release transport system permease subunit
MTSMTSRSLVWSSLRYYWRTNVAVVLGVATAVAVLAGALLVGDSVRGSLRDLVLQRIGRVDRAVISSDFFRERLAETLSSDAGFRAAFDKACPIVDVQGVVSDPNTGRRVSRVEVYGVDDRFWRFHGVDRRSPGPREVLISRSLAADLGAGPGSTVLVRVERPSAVPIESLHGRKDDLGRTVRLGIAGVLAARDMGDFSLRAQQGDVRAIFVSLARLQQDLDRVGRVNTLLVSGRAGVETAGIRASDGVLEELVRRHASLEDVGLRVRSLPERSVVALESAAGVLDEARSQAADRTAAALMMRAQPVLTYLVNSLRGRDSRVIPYSLVTATDLQSVLPAGQSLSEADAPEREGSPLIVLNEWAARDLAAKIGDTIALDYYAWVEPGRLVTRSTDFRVAALVPIAGAAADRDLAPRFPGISDAESLGNWDPPFPIDLKRVRPIDEDYWHRYRTTPKAFVPFGVGERLWRTRFGDRTSVRVTPQPGEPLDRAGARFESRLRADIDPLALGLATRNVRAEQIAASRGATDFGEYFTYFSMFLVVSALLLAALFFRLGVEQRSREVGLLRAVGFTPAALRRLFGAEALLLAAVGSGLGAAGAVAYGSVMMAGLRNWWVGAVGTSALTLHVSPRSLALGVCAALLAAVLCIWATLRGLARVSERRLLVGELPETTRARSGRFFRVGIVVSGVTCAAVGAALVLAALFGVLGRTAAFFGAGSALLAASLCLVAFSLKSPPRSVLNGHGWWPVSRLGFRNATDRPGRTVLAIGIMASAIFILVAVDTFRQTAPDVTDPHSGVGGYPLLVNLLLPLVYDPNSPDGREVLGLRGFGDVTMVPFRVLQGDDTSCLNLYEPKHPRILAASHAFIESGRFAFHDSLASSRAEQMNPWLLLDRSEGTASEPVIPVIADHNSMTYVLHRSLGDDIEIGAAGRTRRLRLVASLVDSLFQSELVMSEENFRKAFPDEEGYRFLLVDAPPARADAVARAIEATGPDAGAEIVSTLARLQEFHRVENTYLSTFQSLGGLGLLIGTVGLAAVVLRNVLERRRELALLGAVGYRSRHVFAIVLAENVLLLGWGLLIGTACALVAVVPARDDRAGWVPLGRSAWLLLSVVFACGLVSSILATRAALRGPLLGALRAE